MAHGPGTKLPHAGPDGGRLLATETRLCALELAFGSLAKALADIDAIDVTALTDELTALAQVLRRPNPAIPPEPSSGYSALAADQLEELAEGLRGPPA